ncbi:MAG: iron chelate uptake ABC transporter family permease subunit [Eggerthellaceae bacterium]|nr:iron chelate uptake ABC transporter family permease subunit [Eggerthellaceae bacterium]
MIRTVRVLLLVLCKLCLGSFYLNFGDSIQVLLDQWLHIITPSFFSLSLLCVLIAIVCDIAFVLPGCVCQNVLRNPLASTSTMGIYHGATFCAPLQ